MINERPTNPDVIKAINACILDLHRAAKALKKAGKSWKAGPLLDNATALELVRDWGAYGGKVPYPVNVLSMPYFEKHGLTGLIHDAWDRSDYCRPLRNHSR